MSAIVVGIAAGAGRNCGDPLADGGNVVGAMLKAKGKKNND
jgi:hypothetical protein